MTSILALDVGGANLKASDGAAFHVSHYFPLWKNPDRLADALGELTAEAPSADRWAVTMTGELADCFRTKREGVAAIVEAVVRAAGRRKVGVYLTDGRIVAPDEAKRRFIEAAASNWHVLASFVAGRYADAAGLLVDVGSTTCDIIPFAGGRVTAIDRTDTERLASGELVYTGVVRSPVCALVSRLPLKQGTAGVAQELFATTLDAYLLLGRLPEDAADDATADGRPATREFARDRLARCVCADRDSFDDDDARRAAAAVEEAQIQLIADAVRQVVARSPSPQAAVVSGQGEFLARAVLSRIDRVGRIESLTEAIGGEASRAAPAYALAHRAREAW